MIIFVNNYLHQYGGTASFDKARRQYKRENNEDTKYLNKSKSLKRLKYDEQKKNYISD